MFRILFSLIFAIFTSIITLFGRMFFWRINKKDEIYLKNYYDRLFSIDGDREYAEKQTKAMRKVLLVKKELKFISKLKGE